LIAPSFPCGIERLEDQQHAPAILRVEFLLQLAEPRHTFAQHLLGRRFVRLEPTRVPGIEVFQFETATVTNDERLDEFFDPALAHGPLRLRRTDAAA
jgi:hypothetical protein